MTHARGQLTVAQNLVNAARNELIGAQNEVNATRNGLTGVRTEITGLRNDLTAVKSEVAEIRAKVTGTRAEVTSLRNDLAGDRLVVTATRAEVAGTRTVLTGLQTELAGARAKVTGFHYDVAMTRNELSGLQNKLPEARDMHTGARDELIVSEDESPLACQHLDITAIQSGLSPSTPNDVLRAIDAAANSEITEEPVAALVSEHVTPQPVHTAPHLDALPPHFVEHLENRLAAQRDGIIEEFNAVARSVAETARHHDESNTIRVLAEGSHKVALAAQESLSSQGEHVARLEGDLSKYHFAFGDDPAGFVRALVSESTKPVNDRVTALEVQAAATYRRVDDHDARLTEHDASVVLQGARVDEHDGMLNTLHQDVDGHNRRLDAHDGRFDEFNMQLDDVDTRCDVRCDGLDMRLNGHDCQFEARNEQLNMVDTRLDAHGLQLASVNTHGERLDKHDARLDAHIVRHNVHDRRSAAHDKRLDAHDTRFGAHGTQLETHSIQLYGHEEELDGHYEASTDIRAEVARIQADVVKVLGSLGSDTEVTVDGALAHACLPLRSRLKCHDKSVADLTVRFNEVNGTLFEEQDKRRSMQADLNGYRDALGDDLKATLRYAIDQAVDPLGSRMDGYDERAKDLCGRLDGREESLATAQIDLASVQARLGVISDAFGDDPVAALQKAAASITEPTNSLIRDLGKDLALLGARLDGLESLSSDDRHAITDLQVDVFNMLAVFGDDPRATIRKAITEYVRSLESRVKYLEDKRSSLQDQAEKNQAATTAVRRELSVAQADLLRVTRVLGADTKATVPLAESVKRLDGLVANQQDELASVREHIIRVEGENGAFGRLCRESHQSLVEAQVGQNAHESSQLLHALLAPDVLDQDVKVQQEVVVYSEGDSKGEKMDEESSPVMLACSLGIDGPCDMAGNHETSVSDEPPESTIGGMSSIPPPKECDALMDEDGYGLCSYV